MKQVNLRLDEEDLASIDHERGMAPREAWLRHLIEIGRQHVDRPLHPDAPRGTGRTRAEAFTNLQKDREARADAFRNATQGKKPK